MATTIKMPQLGESVTEGTIERWLVKEGDTVEQYDPLFEVVTDKVNAEVPAEIAGTITKIMVPDGETVAVGTPSPRSTPRVAPPRLRPTADPVAAEAPQVEDAPAEAPAQPEAAADAGPAAVEEQEQAPAAAEAAPAPTADTARAPATTHSRRGRQAPAAATETRSSDGNGAAARMTPAVRRLVREHDIDMPSCPAAERVGG